MGGFAVSWWRKWWWVGAFCSLALPLYLHAMKDKTGKIYELSLRFEEMKKQRTLLLEEKEDLQVQIASQNDPSWIEMILMRDLGVVPEGWLKVHFKK